jgi:hypothetical protein
MNTAENAHVYNFEQYDLDTTLYSGKDMVERLSRTTRGEPGTYGSTPFNPYLISITEQQTAVLKSHTELFSHPRNDVRAELIPEIADFNYSRVHHRLQKNFESFECREHYHFDVIPDELRETAQRVLTGHGSPTENLLIADILGMPSVELASNTHPYGDKEKMGYLDSMRSAVEESINFFDGIAIRPRKNPEQSSWSRTDDFQIKSEYVPKDDQGNELDVEALRMTRTRLLGLVGDYRIFERSSFLLDLTKIDSDIQAQIQAIDKNDEQRTELILAIPRFYASVKTLLREDAFDVAIPIATTSWAVHPERDAKFKNEYWRKHHIGRNRQDGDKSPFDAGYELLGLN